MNVWLVVRSSKAAGSRIQFQGWVSPEVAEAKRKFWRNERDEYGFKFSVKVTHPRRRYKSVRGMR